MQAVELLRTRIVYAENAFAELVLWQVPEPVSGSAHAFKYRFAYVVDRRCVLRYDNESGKGDHRHWGRSVRRYDFRDPEALIEDFRRDIERWNREDRDARRS